MATDENLTISNALNWCCEYLTEKGDKDPRLSSEWLICDVVGLKRYQLYTNLDKTLSESELACLRSSTKRRAAGEPLQYITGKMPFRHIVLKCEPGVLIPRPETEILVDKVLEAIDLAGEDNARVKVIEVGVGSGCISCSIAHERDFVEIIATDISPIAANLARTNADNLGVSERIQVIECDLLSGIPTGYKADVLVSNPPYVPTHVIDEIDQEVSAYEPHLALDGGEDGMDIFRRLVADAPEVLKPNGYIAVELFESKLDVARTILEEDGRWTSIEVVYDLTGRPRHITARLQE